LETDNHNGVILDSLLHQEEAGHVHVVLQPEATFVEVKSSRVYGEILEIRLIPSLFPEMSKVEVLQALDSDRLPVPACVNLLSTFSGKNKYSQLKLERNALIARSELLSTNGFVQTWNANLYLDLKNLIWSPGNS
jgi:hypothetical protein